MSFLCSDGKWVNCPIPSPNFVLFQKDNDELMVREDTIGPRGRSGAELQSDHWELARILALYPEIKGTFLRFPFGCLGPNWAPRSACRWRWSSHPARPSATSTA